MTLWHEKRFDRQPHRIPNLTLTLTVPRSMYAMTSTVILSASYLNLTLIMRSCRHVSFRVDFSSSEVLSSREEREGGREGWVDGIWEVLWLAEVEERLIILR